MRYASTWNVAAGLNYSQRMVEVRDMALSSGVLDYVDCFGGRSSIASRVCRSQCMRYGVEYGFRVVTRGEGRMPRKPGAPSIYDTRCTKMSARLTIDGRGGSSFRGGQVIANGIIIATNFTSLC